MAELVLSDFQAGHSWVKYGVPGTVTDDTAVYKFGSQSLKLVTDGAAGECRIRWTGISPAFNMTGKFFILWVRINDVANLNRIWLYAASTAWTALYTWKPSDAPSHYLQSNDTWIPISLSFGRAIATGAPNRAAITDLQLYAQDKNGIAVTINWGGLHAMDEVGPGILTFAFDDGWNSQYSEGYAKLEDYSFPAVAYVIPDYIGTANYMTTANLDTIYADNWDIAGHYQTNLDGVGDVNAVLDSVQSWLHTNGYTRGVRHFALPGGVWNEGTIMPAVKARFRSCRTIIPYSETRPNGDIYKLRVMMVYNTTTTAAIAAAVTQAINNKEWLILVFHKIVAAPSVSTEYSIANFGTVVDDINAQGIAVRTLSQVFSQSARPSVTYAMLGGSAV